LLGLLSLSLFGGGGKQWGKLLVAPAVVGAAATCGRKRGGIEEGQEGEGRRKAGSCLVELAHHKIERKRDF